MVALSIHFGLGRQAFWRQRMQTGVRGVNLGISASFLPGLGADSWLAAFIIQRAGEGKKAMVVGFRPLVARMS